MVEEQLVVLLYIVVRLVIVVMQFPSLFHQLMQVLYIIQAELVLVEYSTVHVGGIHVSTRVVASSKQLHFCFGCIVPRMVSPFLPCKRNEFDGCVVGIISALQIVGIQIHRCPVDVAVCSDV